VAVQALFQESMRPLNESAQAESDRILRELQGVMFAYDVGILKEASRLEAARHRITALQTRFADIAAPHVHELVRLKETEAMLMAAQLILCASLYRTESRLGHFREDYEQRDDTNWLCWVDVTERDGAPAFEKTPIPMPYCGVDALQERRPKRLHRKYATGAM